MMFRNVRTGHILRTENEDCIEIMRASSAYEVIPAVQDAPEAEPHQDVPEAGQSQDAPEEKAKPGTGRPKKKQE